MGGQRLVINRLVIIWFGFTGFYLSLKWTGGGKENAVVFGFLHSGLYTITKTVGTWSDAWNQYESKNTIVPVPRK